MSDSRGRWWEIQGEGQPDETGYRELVTDSRGRSRPERSLSVGADLADEPRHRSRAFLWPVVSVVAAVGLILSVIYVSKDKPPLPPSATPAQPAVQGSAPQAPAPPSDAGTQRSVLPDPSGNPPAADGGASTSGSRAGISQAQAAAPSGPAVDPGGPVPALTDSSGGAGRDTGNQPTETPTLKTDAAPQDRPFTLEEGGFAPDAPGAQQARRPVPVTGGCRFSDTSGYYDCTIIRKAPRYHAGANYSNSSTTGRPLFLCQSAGSRYWVENRSNNWWAWLQEFGGWVPVVFLEGGPDDAPQPGLPVCGSAPTPTTTSPDSSSAGSAEASIADRQTGRCLDSDDQGEVRTAECDRSDNQKWVFRKDGTIRDKQTGRCLDSNDEDNVHTVKCDSTDNQKWNTPGDHTIRDRQTTHCLDSDDEGKVHTVKCDESDNQKWKTE